MKQVTKEEFYARVGPLNVAAQIQPGPHPYTSIWKLQGGDWRTIGKSVDRYATPGRLITDYFLAGEA